MLQIDTSVPVMVTGATGYVAGWVVKRLLEEGLTVHAPVRDPDNPEKLKYLNEIAAKYPPKTDRPLEELADMLSSILEGGIIMSKVLDDNDALTSQLLQYRNYIRLVFAEESM